MKGIIFDLDGVICHTDEYHYEAWKLLADRLGIYFDKTVNNRLRGVSRMESLNIILEKSDKEYSAEEKLAFATEKNETYKKLLEKMSVADLSEEVKTTLEILKTRGYKLAIGSSSKNARFILKQLGISNMFDAISDGNNITRSKPDPEVFIKAAEYVNLPNSECAVVEDAFAGIDAAKAGEFLAVGIGDAARYEKTDKPIATFGDLLDIFE